MIAENTEYTYRNIYLFQYKKFEWSQWILGSSVIGTLHPNSNFVFYFNILTLQVKNDSGLEGVWTVSQNNGKVKNSKSKNELVKPSH